MSSALRSRRDPREDLTTLKLDFLSPVDRPAQEGATALLLKRAGFEEDKPVEGLVMKNGTPGVLTSETDGHTHIVWLHGMVGETTMQRSPDSEGHHDHPWTLNPDGSITVGANDGHDHTVPNEAVTAALVALQKNQGAAPGVPNEENDMDAKTQKALEDRIEAAEQRAEKAEQTALLHALRGGMTTAQLSHFDGLDETAKAAFASLTTDDRDAELTAIEKAASDADPVLYTSKRDGTIVRKSDGDLVLRLVKRADAAEVRAEAAESTSLDTTLRKRAEGELGSLPGTVDEKVALLKGLEAIPEGPARDAALKALKAGNDAIANGFQAFGGADGSVDEGSSEGKLDALVKRHSAEKGVSEAEAYNAVLETAEGQRLYNESVVQ